MPRPRRRPAVAVALAGALMAGAAGCSAGSEGPQADRESTSAPASAAASPTPADPPRVYVAVGASETVGVGADDPATEAWPRVLHDTGAARRRFVDVGVSGATVRRRPHRSSWRARWRPTPTS